MESGIYILDYFNQKTRDNDNDNFKQNKTKQNKTKQIGSILAFILACAFSVMAEAATTFTTIHSFTNDTPGGLALAVPDGFLAQGRDGNLYGTAESEFFPSNGGAFKISPAGVYTRLHNFNPLVEGRIPKSGFSIGNDGNFYGTTAQSRSVFGLVGTIFRMTPAGNVTVLHDFKLTSPTCNVNDAAGTTSPPVQGRDGNWYGTTQGGGNCNVAGTVYKLTTANSFSVIHHFNGTTDGGIPEAPLILGKDGNFYGTTRLGGSFNGVTAFRVTPSGSLKVLHNFVPTNAESSPFSPLIQGADGNFYGTASGVGGFSGSSIFRVTPSGVLKILHKFDFVNAFSDGATPTAGLVQASDGNFYGTTSLGGLNNFSSSGCGVLFKITPTGVYSVLHRFDNATDGCISRTGSLGQSMTLHTNGKIYGSTKFGGIGGIGGTIFELDIGARPFIRPQVLIAKVGEKITLYGDFSGTISGVTFGVVSATIFTRDLNNPNNTLSVTIPVGAKTGPIVVIKATVNITTIKTFNILPTFTSFSPTSGVVGATVILKGTGLSQTTRVAFAANKTAPFTADNDGQLTVNVPIGAVTGKINIATKGGSVSSVAKFTVTP